MRWRTRPRGKSTPRTLRSRGFFYGAGVSLLALGNDPRVKTAVAFSGWGNVEEGFYYNKSPNFSVVGLMEAANATGVPSDVMLQFYHEMITHTDMPTFHALSALRSPELLYLAEYNRRQTPIFLVNDYLDRYFFPQAQMRFWARLTGPKMVFNLQGVHASQSAIGALAAFLPNTPWDAAKRFLDHHLRGIDNGVQDEPFVHFQESTSMLSKKFTTFRSWPYDANRTRTALYALMPRGTARFGTLAPLSGGVVPTLSASDPLKFAPDVPFGQQVEQDDKTQFGIPATVSFASGHLDAYRNVSLAYWTAPATESRWMCGIPRLNVSMTTDDAAGKFQLYAFLYVVDPLLETGELISSTVTTTWNATASAVRGAPAQVAAWDFRSVCRALPKGKALAVGFTAYDPWFLPATNASATGAPLQLGIAFGPAVAVNVLEVPFVAE